MRARGKMFFNLLFLHSRIVRILDSAHEYATNVQSHAKVRLLEMKQLEEFFVCYFMLILKRIRS